MAHPSSGAAAAGSRESAAAGSRETAAAGSRDTAAANGRCIEAVLFDLDGTLLKIDVERFFPEYFARLSTFVSTYISADDFMPRLMRSTTKMIENTDGRRTNQEVFVDEFFAGLEARKEELLPVFDRFYLNEFPDLRRYSAPVPGARAVVEKTLASGRKAAVATAPVFPRTAIIERLRWAGLADLPFSLVTSYEDMHFCKPRPEYYLEIAERLGCRPENCLMVGNDVEEDLVAKDVGMATFLVGPDIIHRGRRPCEPDWQGVLADLPAILERPASA